jgi:hypothetical protein
MGHGITEEAEIPDYEGMAEEYYAGKRHYYKHSQQCSEPARGQPLLIRPCGETAGHRFTAYGQIVLRCAYDASIRKNVRYRKGRGSRSKKERQLKLQGFVSRAPYQLK